MKHALPYHARPKNGKLQTALGLSLLVIGCLYAFAVKAAENPLPDIVQCSRVQTAIIPLRTVTPVKNLPWARTMGLQGMDRFIAASAGPKGTLLLWGESQPYNLETQTPGQRMLYRVMLDAKGKVQEETRIPLPDAGKLQDIIAVGSTFYALDKMENGKFFLRGFNAAGKLQVPLPLDGMITAIIPDGAAHIMLLGQDDKKAARLQRMTLPSGKIDWTRLYMPGTPGELKAALKQRDDTWVVAGQVQGQGWFMALTANGAIMSQRVYSRGMQADILSVARLNGGGALLTGIVVGKDDAKTAALWLMRVAPNGDMVWQRHITGPYSLTPVAAQATLDGRLLVIANALPTYAQSIGRGQVRRLILTERGDLIDHQAFQDGVLTSAQQAVAAQQADKPALVLGASQTGFVEEGSAKALMDAALDAWVVALPPLKDYTDACPQE